MAILRAYRTVSFLTLLIPTFAILRALTHLLPQFPGIHSLHELQSMALRNQFICSGFRTNTKTAPSKFTPDRVPCRVSLKLTKLHLRSCIGSESGSWRTTRPAWPHL